MVVFVPDDGSAAEAQALTPAGSEAMGGERMRLFQGQGIGEGQQAGVVLASLSSAPTSGRTTGGSGGGLSGVVIAGGVAALVVGIAAVLWRKK
jgi:hypothetical protein